MISPTRRIGRAPGFINIREADYGAVDTDLLTRTTAVSGAELTENGCKISSSSCKISTLC
jgi:hypothetical protein